MASTPSPTIFALVLDDLVAVEETLARAVEADGPMMRRLLSLVLPGGGKRLRPALALLCGRIVEHHPGPVVSFAAALEMLHTATLVHDDIVDDAPTRRGVPTLKSKVNNSIAVLVGDYMFAQSAAHTATTGNLAVITAFAQTSMTVIAGQIDETTADGGLSLTKDQYYRRIGSKTAALFALAAQGGAMLSAAPTAVAEALSRYGYALGLAFQVVDDILDVVGDEGSLGKPVGSDIRQGTVTLPAILVRDQLPGAVFQAAFLDNVHREEAMSRLLEAMRTGGGVDRSYDEAQRLAREACQQLDPVPPGELRDALVDLALYVTRRHS